MFENEYKMDIRRYQRWTTPIFYKVLSFWPWLFIFLLSTVGAIIFYKNDLPMRWKSLALMLMLISVYRSVLFRPMLAGKQFKLMRLQKGKKFWNCKVVVGNTIRLYEDGEFSNEVFFKQVKKFVEAKSYFDLAVDNDFVRLDKAGFPTQGGFFSYLHTAHKCQGQILSYAIAVFNGQICNLPHML